MRTKLIFIGLFALHTLITLYASGANTIGGDEVAAYISLIPFLQSLLRMEFFPSFLTFFHEPGFLLIQLPVVVAGANQVWVRLPNILATLLQYWVLYKIGKVLWPKKDFFTLVLLLLYVVNGHFKVYRAELNHSFFNLSLTTAFYFLIKDRLIAAYSLLLLTCFIYIDAVFTIPGFLYYYWSKNGRSLNPFFARKIIIPSVIAGVVALLWAGSVFAGSIVSRAYTWQSQAPFSLLARGTAYSLTGIIDNFHLFSSSNSLEYIVLVFGFAASALFLTKARPVWVLIFIPVIYFNLVKMPTVHLLNFFILILVACTLGIEDLMKKLSFIKVIVVLAIVLSVLPNLKSRQWYDPRNYDNNFKFAATYLRNSTPPCETIFTDMDGYTFRFYFNHPYTTLLTPQTKWAVVVKGENHQKLQNSGLYKKAEVLGGGKIPIYIYERNYSGGIEQPKEIDTNYFTFTNTLSYVTACRS